MQGKEAAGTLVLFDFDGTLTRKDTLFEIIKYIKGKSSFYRGILCLSPFLSLYQLKLISAKKTKERMLKYFFKGMEYDIFIEKCNGFGKDILPSLIKNDALKALNNHKLSGHDIYIVSASAEEWLKVWCHDKGISCIATRLEVKENKLTGKINGKNCNGMEKVNRIRETIDLSLYQNIVVYGDTQGDKPMLQLATEAHYRPFHK